MQVDPELSNALIILHQHTMACLQGQCTQALPTQRVKCNGSLQGTPGKARSSDTTASAMVTRTGPEHGLSVY